MMKKFAFFTKKPKQYFSKFFPNNLLHGSSLSSVLVFNIHPFFLQLCYFMILSLFGYLGLKFSKPRTPAKPNDFDLFYTSVSATTVSSMVAVEMEAFSNSQLILITFLMFVGGEVFTSMLDLLLARFKFTHKQNNNNNVKNKISTTIHSSNQDGNNQINVNGQIELGIVSVDHSNITSVPNGTVVSFNDTHRLKYSCLRYLTLVVLGYLIMVNFVGFGLVTLYLTVIPSARQVLKNKNINIVTFSLFTIISTFASCGFVPTNENMMVFKKNSGLLLLILPHVFLGNTLYPPCLRLVLTVLKKVTKKEEFSYILRNSKEIGYDHLLSGVRCWLLSVTVIGFFVIQLVMVCCVEWNNTKIMEDLNVYEKLVASLFQVTNARHAGESVFDLSAISSAILVLFIVMMYLPPYTTFWPVKKQENEVKREEKSLIECLVFSQLSYLVIFVILICITESKSLKEDPLNFNVLNITLEVISAYGNVGFSTGYSCARQLKPGDDGGMCKDSWVGFSGRWSSKGKFILILVMFFGRLKKFNMQGGKAWHLS